MMEHSQPVSQDTPSNVRDTLLSGKRFGTWFAETIRASGRVRRVNRPDTRLLLTSAKISFKYVLLCSGYPHRTFATIAVRNQDVCQSGHDRSDFIDRRRKCQDGKRRKQRPSRRAEIGSMKVFRGLVSALWHWVLDSLATIDAEPQDYDAEAKMVRE